MNSNIYNIPLIEDCYLHFDDSELEFQAYKGETIVGLYNALDDASSRIKVQAQAMEIQAKKLQTIVTFYDSMQTLNDAYEGLLKIHTELEKTIRDFEFIKHRANL